MLLNFSFKDAMKTETGSCFYRNDFYSVLFLLKSYFFNSLSWSHFFNIKKF